MSAVLALHAAVATVATASQDGGYAFRDVTVISTAGEPVRRHQTVLVSGDRIVALGPADSISLLPATTIIEGAGKFLMPGLADMHVHLPGADSSGMTTRNTLTLFLASGVTTIRVMSGAFRHLAVRDSIARGELLGPRMLVAGSAVGALPGNTADLRRVLDRGEIAKFAEEMKRAGYDFIQINSGMVQQEYDALTSAARRAGIRITGGVPADVGLDRAVRARQSSIENLEGYLQAVERDDSPLRYSDPVSRARKLAQYFDPAKITRAAKNTYDAGIFNTPTLFLTYVAYTAVTADDMAKWPEMRYVSPPVLADWIRRKNRADEFLTDPNEGARLISFRMAMTRGLAQAGARLLVGSDAPATFLVPGFATLYEMHSLTVAGVPAAQVLRAATLSAAEFVGAGANFGTIAPGKVADLLLLDADPLQDIANLAMRAGVMSRGRWFPAQELNAMLDDVARTNGVGNARVRDR
jgi:imidazolonepropionase-like amidohydrolase